MNDSNNNTNPWTRNTGNSNSSNGSSSWNNPWSRTDSSGNHVDPWGNSASNNSSTNNNSNSWAGNSSNNTASWNNTWNNNNNNSSNINNWNNNSTNTNQNSWNGSNNNFNSGSDNNQDSSTEFSTIQKLSGRVQNKHQAVNAVLFYTNVINVKSVANWILFGMSIGLSLIFLICAGIYQNILSTREWVRPKETAMIFTITWVALNTFWVTVIALKHTIMYFAQTKDNGSELLIVSKPVTRKILYWSRVLYFFIYITIYSFILFFLTIIFCAAIGFNNITFLPISPAAFVFLTPFVFIFFGMTVMSFTSFFCTISSTKTVNTIASLTTLSSITFYGITPLIVILSESNYQSNASSRLQHWTLEQAGIDSSEYSRATQEFSKAIYEKILEDIKSKYINTTFRFEYRRNQWDTITRTYTVDNIINFKVSTPDSDYGSSDSILFKNISFSERPNNNDEWQYPDEIIALDSSYRLVIGEYGDQIGITWNSDERELYQLTNDLTSAAYYYYNKWISGDGGYLVDQVKGTFNKRILKKGAQLIGEQLSYSNLNKYAPLATMDYLNYFSMPTKLLGFGKAPFSTSGSYGGPEMELEPGQLVYGFDWCTRYMPKLISDDQQVFGKNITITRYRMYNEQLPKASPGWGVALFWVAVSTSALFSSYYLFKKKDFR